MHLQIFIESDVFYSVICCILSIESLKNAVNTCSIWFNFLEKFHYAPLTSSSSFEFSEFKNVLWFFFLCWFNFLRHFELYSLCKLQNSISIASVQKFNHCSINVAWRIFNKTHFITSQFRPTSTRFFLNLIYKISLLNILLNVLQFFHNLTLQHRT